VQRALAASVAELDRVVRAPLPQRGFLGLAREVVPAVGGAAARQQGLEPAVAALSPEVVANFVIGVRQEPADEIEDQGGAEIEFVLLLYLDVLLVVVDVVLTLLLFLHVAEEFGTTVDPA
jgi:hypothetical protein